MPLVWNAAGAWPLLVSLLAWALAAVVLFTRPDRAQNRLLALATFVEPFMFAFGSALMAFTDSGRDARGLVAVSEFVGPIFLAAYLGFLGTLDTPLARPLRSRAGRALTILLVPAGWVTLLLVPGINVGVAPSQVTTWRSVLQPEYTAVRLLFVALFLVGLVLAVSMWRRAAPGSVTRQRARLFAAAFGARDVGVSLLMVYFGVVAPGAMSTAEGEALAYALFPLPTLVFLLLAAFGILRHQLFDVELKLKLAVEKTTILAAFAVAFLVVSELVERVLAVEGLLFGLAAAVAVGLVFRRVEGVARRVADRAMPGVRDTPEYRTVRKREVYQAAVESALQDGTITEKERDVLATLADQLGLGAGEARALERDVQARAQGAG